MAKRLAKNILAELGVRPRKERGQNFIIDPAVIAAIVDFGNPAADEQLLEIGPGLGALTEALYRFGRLTVVEIEEKFCRDLKQRFPALTVIKADFREAILSDIGNNLVVFGNLPYAFSTEILFHLIDNAAGLKRAVLLLQREFAQRLAANPGGRDFGVLSISCQLWADVELGPIIPGNCFHPPTKVESRLVKLKFLHRSRYPIKDYLGFRLLVRAAFQRRRKKLFNSLLGSSAYPREVLQRALTAAQIDGGRRAETLSIEEYVRLAESLESFRQG